MITTVGDLIGALQRFNNNQPVKANNQGVQAVIGQRGGQGLVNIYIGAAPPVSAVGIGVTSAPSPGAKLLEED